MRENLDAIQTTVVIPSFNGKRFIKSALDSVLRQSVLPKEILVVDDCSTDGSDRVVENFAVGCTVPVRLLRLDSNSGGPVKPMGIGIRHATTDFVTLLDQDDQMLPNRIESQVSALVSVPTAFACIGYLIRIDANGESINDGFLESTQTEFIALSGLGIPGAFVLDPEKARRYGFVNGTFTIASSTTVRKSFWEDLGGFSNEFRIAWDFDFSLRGLNRYDIVCVDGPVGYYRIHAGNTSGNSYRCLQEVARCRRTLLTNPGKGLDRSTVRKRVASDSFGLSFIESDKGMHREAVLLAFLAVRLTPGWRYCDALVRACVKYTLSVLGLRGKSTGV